MRGPGRDPFGRAVADASLVELPKLISGSQPIDNGQYIFSSEQAREEFLSAEPAAAPFLRPYVSALDYLRNRHRWILALHDAPPNVLAGMPRVRERIACVRELRSRSKREQTLMLADYRTRYNSTSSRPRPSL